MGTWRGYLGVGLIALGFYLPHLQVPFTFDDQTLIEGNLFIRSFAYLLQFLFSPRVESGGHFDGAWRPLSVASLTVNYAWSGLAPWGYRLTNALLHAAVAMTVLAVVKQLVSATVARGIPVAVFGALVFALHPLQSQTLLHVWKRTGMWSALFMLLGVWAFLRLRRHRQLVVVLAMQGLALMSKEDGFLLPFLLLAVGLGWPQYLKSQDHRRTLIVSFLLTLFYIPFYGWWIRTSGGMSPSSLAAVTAGVAEFSYGQKQLVVLWRMGQLMLWPASLNVDHRTLVSTSELYSAVVGLLGLGLLWLTLLRRDRRWLTVGLWILFPLAPFLLVRVNILLDESRAYIPLAGIALGVALTFQWVQAKKPKWERLWVAATVLAIFLLGICTTFRALDWHDPVRLWAKSVEADRGNVRAQQGLVLALLQQNRAAEALTPARASVRIAPNMDMSWLVWGRVEDALGRPSAHEKYQRAIEINPRMDEAWNNLGAWYADQKAWDQAEVHFRKALEINPYLLPAQRNLYRLQQLLGK